jgi:hypothetical protein
MADLPVDGNIVFQTDNMYDIGPAGANRPRDVYVAGRVLVIDNNHVLGGNANDMTLAHLGQNGTIQLRTYNANRWQITSSGHLQAVADNAYDIGASGANRPRNIYTAGAVFVRSASNWLDASGVNTVLAADGSGEVIVRTAGAQRWKVDNAGKFLAVTDNAYDIGSASAGRAHDLYLGRQFEGSGQVRAKGWFAAGSGHGAEIGVSAGEGFLISYDRPAGGYKPLVVSGSETYLGYSGNKAWKVGSGGHLQAVADNVYDIGTSSANRPRIGYFGSGVVVGSDGIKWKASGSNQNVMYASGSEDIQILRHFGTKKSTLLKIWAPNGAVTDREATIALVRGDNDEEFIDIYNNGYPDGDPVSVQYGIRVQRRGTGSYQPFVFDQDDGAEHGVNIKPMFVLRADRNAEFRAEWVRLPIPDTTSGNPDTSGWDVPEEGRIWFNNKSSPKAVKFWNGSAVKTLSGS